MSFFNPGPLTVEASLGEELRSVSGVNSFPLTDKGYKRVSFKISAKKAGYTLSGTEYRVQLGSASTSYDTGTVAFPFFPAFDWYTLHDESFDIDPNTPQGSFDISISAMLRGGMELKAQVWAYLVDPSF